MRLRLKVAAAAALVVAACCTFFALPNSQAADERKSGPMVAHIVFFTLKDQTPAAREALVAACKKYLTGHEGTVYFSAGARAPEFDRPVNDKEFDVALHLIFKDKASHDLYADAPRHLDFINENKETWAEVRVFDSYVTE